MEEREFEQRMSAGGAEAVAEACRFFMGDDPVHKTLTRMAERLEELSIPYAIAGGMALVAHGYTRTTVGVDILVTKAGLEQLHRELVGRGYRPAFAGGKALRDTETGVRVEFLVTGGFPGDGKPKPVAFPDPGACATTIGGAKYLSLESLIELKLSSGMTSPRRLRDLADVMELAAARKLGPDFAQKLDPYVRGKFLELLRDLEQGEAVP
jgi:hypothetical protein